MSDVNYFSISNDGYTIDAGSPDARQVTELPEGNSFTPLRRDKYSDILKFSNRQSFSLTNVYVSQGKEDSVDINNRCSNITLQGNFAIEGYGKQVFTIKGGSKDIFISGVIENPGNHTDVEIGNWSDQSKEKTTNVQLNLRRMDGKPVRVIIGHASNITLGGNCKKDVWGSLLLQVYMKFRLIFG